MAALQYAHVPGYAALLLRRTFRDLNQPDSLIPRSKEWLMGRASWSAIDKRWTFPSGATLTFGYLDHEDDVYQYQSSAFQFIGFDELTQFPETWYRYLFSRLRRHTGVDVPLRMRAGSNPGGLGHEWVKRRFVAAPPSQDRLFIPSQLDDNPSLDRDQYVQSLSQLDPILRAQLLAGDWDAYIGGRFRKEWFRRYTVDGRYYHLQGRNSPFLIDQCHRFLICDPATTAEETTRKGQDADYTAIGVFATTPARDLLVLDMTRKRLGLDEIVPEIARVCERWQPNYIGIESVGFQAALTLQAKRFPGMPAVRSLMPSIGGMRIPGQKGKLTRATPAIVLCEAGQLFLPTDTPWLEDFEAELVQFTGDDKLDAHDDQVDVLAYAVLQRDGSNDDYIIPKIAQPNDGGFHRINPHGGQTNAQRRGLFGRK